MTAWHELITIVRNAASSYGTRLVRGLSVLLITPYLFRRLGPAGFGTWGVMFTMTIVFSLLETGFSVGVTRFVAQFRARDQRAELNATVGSAVLLMGAAGVLAALVSVAMAYLAPGLAAGGEKHDFQVGMAVIGIAMIVRFPFAAYGAALMGYQRYELYNVAQTVTAVAFAVGAVIAIEIGSGVLGLAVAHGASLVLGGLCYALFLLRVDRAVSLLPRFGDRAARRRVGGFGSLALLADSMVFIGQRMDTLVIAAIRDARTAAPFAAATKLAGGLQALTFPFVMLLMPMASDLHARGRHAEIVRRFTIATRVALQITLPTAVGFAIFASDIVQVWLGGSAPKITAAIIAVLMAVQISTLSAYPAEKVLVGIGRVKMVAVLAVIEGITNILLSIALVIAYGAIGAAIGTLLTSAVLSPIKFPLACRATGCSMRRFAREGIWTAVAGSLPGIAAMLAVGALLPVGGLRLAVGLTLGLAVSAAVAAAQIGPRRTLQTLRAMRAGASEANSPQAPRALPAEGAQWNLAG
jgi:O-antigen/teichoic acid export membrane protein